MKWFLDAAVVGYYYVYNMSEKARFIKESIKNEHNIRREL
jgi:hypothetical protein